MKRTITAALLAGVFALSTGAVPAQAATHKSTARHFGPCISTRWAVHHYHRPMTPPGGTCVVWAKSEFLPGDISDPTPYWQITDMGWTPEYWDVEGFINNKAGHVIWVIERRPR